MKQLISNYINLLRIPVMVSLVEDASPDAASGIDDIVEPDSPIRRIYYCLSMSYTSFDVIVVSRGQESSYGGRNQSVS